MRYFYIYGFDIFFFIFFEEDCPSIVTRSYKHNTLQHKIQRNTIPAKQEARQPPIYHHRQKPEKEVSKFSLKFWNRLVSVIHVHPIIMGPLILPRQNVRTPTLATCSWGIIPSGYANMRSRGFLMINYAGLWKYKNNPAEIARAVSRVYAAWLFCPSQLQGEDSGPELMGAEEVWIWWDLVKHVMFVGCQILYSKNIE